MRQTFAGAPWIDPATRNVGRISGVIYDAALDVQRDRERQAEEARKALVEARQRVGLLDRLAGFLGIRTTTLRDVDEAESRALRAQGDSEHGGYALRDESRRADQQASRIVRDREQERQGWERRPEVQAASREAHGNELVHAAVAAGDPQVTALAGQDLTAARELLLRREAEEARLRLEATARAQQQQQARQQQAAAPATAMFSGPRR